MPINVYHSSKIQGLKQLEPRVSTHKESWLYAAKDLASAALFLGDNFDFICQVGFEETPFIWERFAGAFELGYKNQSGSIYVLNGTNFKSGLTSWEGDLVSTNVEEVKEEIFVPDVAEYLTTLAQQNKLKIYFYPETPANFPQDKSDIVDKAVKWTMEFGEGTLEQIKKYHPDVLGKVIEKLKSLNYNFKSSNWLE